MAKDRLYEVAYNEAVRALSEQQAAIESLRTRAGLLLSAAAITTSFLGAQALQGGDSSFFSGVALLSFVAVALSALVILWPRQWELTANPIGVIEKCIESPASAQIEELYRDLSLQMHDSYLENHRGLERLAVFFQAAIGFLTTEIVLWIVAIEANL